MNTTQPESNHNATLLYIGGEHCSVCHALYPKVEAMLDEDFPLMELVPLEVTKDREKIAQLGVFTNPTVIIYFEGKEFFRKSRTFSIKELHGDIERPYSILIQK